MIVTETWILTKRNLFRYIRVPQLLVFSTLQPIMFVLLFAFVFGGAIKTPGDYIDYIIPAIMIQVVLFGANRTAIGLADDLQKGLMDRFRSLPISRSSLVTGRTLADTIRNLFVVILIVATGYLLGFNFSNGLLLGIAAILFAVFFGFAATWISAFIGLLVKDPETAQVAGFIWVFPLVFASSAFVPVETMPGWLRTFAEVQPVSMAITGIRSMTLLEPSIEILYATLWALGIIAVFVPLTVWQYRRSV